MPFHVVASSRFDVEAATAVTPSPGGVGARLTRRSGGEPMVTASALELARDPALPDEEVVRRVRAGETWLYEVLMRRHNPKVYRAVRSILRDEAEAEDAMQQAYLAAYSRLDQFQGASRFSTWLVSVALNEARSRARRADHPLELAAVDGAAVDPSAGPPAPDPEHEASMHELVTLTEKAIDRLPPLYRMVFVLREVEGLDTAEAAAALGSTEDVVKTRLRRARALLRDALATDLDRVTPEAFPFPARRCDRVVAAVLARLPGR
jgi:RNA polymerase sigma-70 factor, ECF subfamily